MTRSKIELKSLSTDKLWELHDKVSAMLKTKIKARTKMLEERLARINARLREQVGCRMNQRALRPSQPPLEAKQVTRDPSEPLN